MLIQKDASPGSEGLEHLQARLSAVSLHFVPRRPVNGARYAWCYWNVRDHVAQFGGQIRYGWLITEFKSLMLLAWHHAVWQRSDGMLLDITPHGTSGFGEGITAFLEDPIQTYDLSWPPAHAQQFEPLVSDPRVDDFIHAYQVLFALQSDYLERQRAVPGVECDVYSGSLRVQDPKESAKLRELESIWKPKIDAADARRALFQDGLLACQYERLRETASLP
jgi:hypothetical protein